MTTPASALVAYCRAGFEAEAGADLHRLAAAADTAVTLDASPGSGYVIGRLRSGPQDLVEVLRGTVPVFARSVFVAQGPFALVPDTGAVRASVGAVRADRVTPLLAAIAGVARPPWRSAWVEFPDTNDGKALSPLARALESRVAESLRADRVLRDDAPKRLHVFLADGATAWVGESPARDGQWPLGIARLRMPGGAPSRSTLKLAEAFVTFLGAREHTLLRPGLHAVDLGAAPGGWTWQLVQRGVRVIAVDNGPLKGPVAADPLVTHVREDAFAFRARRPVDWLVCDVVESPMRIAELVARWIAEGRARRAIFNLKLPMKRRDHEVQRCLRRMDEIAQAAGTSITIAVRQLYHDREEVTGYVARVD